MRDGQVPWLCLDALLNLKRLHERGLDLAQASLRLIHRGEIVERGRQPSRGNPGVSSNHKSPRQGLLRASKVPTSEQHDAKQIQRLGDDRILWTGHCFAYFECLLNRCERFVHFPFAEERLGFFLERFRLFELAIWRRFILRCQRGDCGHKRHNDRQ